jgi:hypothetical protein
MTFLLVLAVATSAAAAGLALRRRFSTRTAARIGMALAMAFAGISHLLMPTPFVQHLPGWVPLREELVLLTGLLEIALGLALLLRQPSWRCSPRTSTSPSLRWRWTGNPAAPTRGCGFRSSCSSSLGRCGAPGASNRRHWTVRPRLLQSVASSRRSRSTSWPCSGRHPSATLGG